MKVVTVYVAEDGKQFSKQDYCQEYEQFCECVNAANEMLENGATLYAVLAKANEMHSWWADNIGTEEKVMLMRMNKDSKLAVPHWQCRSQPGYKFCRLNNDGTIFLFGDAGSWSGSYGNNVSVREFCGYAKDTFAKFPSE